VFSQKKSDEEQLKNMTYNMNKKRIMRYILKNYGDTQKFD